MHIVSKMNKTFSIFNDTGIDKCKLHYDKYPILIDDVVIDKKTNT